MTELRVTGPNGDGEYWLHIKAGGKMGGVNLGAAHGPIVQRLLNAATIEQPVQEPVQGEADPFYEIARMSDENAALRAKLAEVERMSAVDKAIIEKTAADAVQWKQRAERAEADRDEERKLADDLIAIVEGIDGAMNHGTWRDEKGTRLKDTPQWVALYNAARRKEQQG